MRTQKHARRKGGNVSGEIKAGFYDSKGRWHANPKPVEVNGRMTYPAQTYTSIETKRGDMLRVSIREAFEMISDGRAKIQLVEAL